VWEKIAKAITDSAIFKAAVKLWNGLMDAVNKVFNYIAKLWNDFKKWLGLESDAKVTVKPSVSIDTSDVSTDLGTVDGGSGKSGKTTKVKTAIQKKVAPVKGSLDETESQINSLTSKLKNTDTNDKEAVASLKKQIAELQKVADAQKIQLGLTVESAKNPEGSLKDI